MTNITYFYNTIREYYSSASSSASSSFSERQPSQNHYGPPEEVKAKEEENSTVRAISPQPVRIEDKDSGQKLSSKFVFPVPTSRSSFRCFDATNFRYNSSNAGRGWVAGRELRNSEMPGRSSVAVYVQTLQQNGYGDHKELLEKGYILAGIEHPNLVRLLGYGFEDTLLLYLLVYEFTENHLNLGSFPTLKVPLLNVVLDAAKGLAFLHSSKVVHGHFKGSIILDSNSNAKLFGFGLTKNSPCPTKYPKGVMETPTGDFGYVNRSETIYNAPEYLYTGRFSAESDVYSFGVVFLEILFARQAFGKFWPLEEQNLVEWIKSNPHLKPKLVNVLEKSGENAVLLALRCLSVDVKLRPTMDEVVKALEELVNESNANWPKSNAIFHPELCLLK